MRFSSVAWLIAATIILDYDLFWRFPHFDGIVVLANARNSRLHTNWSVLFRWVY